MTIKETKKNNTNIKRKSNNQRKNKNKKISSVNSTKSDYLMMKKNFNCPIKRKTKDNNNCKIDNNKVKNLILNIPKSKAKNKKSRANSYNNGPSMTTMLKTNKVNQNIINKVNDIMQYNNDELNLLSYDLAILYDKRTYSEYYISLVKTKHILIFSFFNTDDYNSRAIKIDLFLFSFSLLYTVNALFFNDNTIYEINQKKGAFDFIYQLPTIIYSSLISSGLNALLKLLALTNQAITEFKENKSLKNLEKRIQELKYKLKIKLILYFIISSIFLCFFWYYLSMFCAIYKNTQLYLIKDTLISFSFSMIYPFGIYLLPGIFRIPSLSNHKEKRTCLYRFSKLLQKL